MVHLASFNGDVLPKMQYFQSGRGGRDAQDQDGIQGGVADAAPSVVGAVFQPEDHTTSQKSVAALLWLQEAARDRELAGQGGESNP